jgi:hypothetical protein
MNATQIREVPAAITQLRAEIEKLPKDSGGKRKGVTDDLKRRAAALATGGIMPLPDLAKEISVSVSALTVWRNRFGSKASGSRGATGFRRVSVTPVPVPQTRGITIEGPGGMKISGLSPEEVAQLWRSLC